MQSSKKDESVGFDAYWEAVGEILDGELYLAGGYETAHAFIEAAVKEPERTVQRMVRVAKYATPAQEAKYGTSRLDAAITYVEGLTGGPASGSLKIDFDTLRIPVERDGRTIKKGLGEVSIQELSSTTRALVRKTGKARARSSPAEQAIVDALGGHEPPRR